MVFMYFNLFLFLWEEKYKENLVIFKSTYLVNFWHGQHQIWYAR